MVLQFLEPWLDRKPYKEVFDCRVRPKVSPRRKHAMVEGVLFRLLADWAEGRGDVGVEWRAYLNPLTTLVPDVSYYARGRLQPLNARRREQTPFAPDIAVEVYSPGDRPSRIRRKVALYLQYGATIVLGVDVDRRRVIMDTTGSQRVFETGERVEHPAFPGLSIPVAAIFAPLDRR